MDEVQTLDLYEVYYSISSNDPIDDYKISPITTEQVQYMELVQTLSKSDVKLNQFNAKQYMELLYAIKQHFPDLYNKLLTQNVLQNLLSFHQLNSQVLYQEVLRSFYKINIEVNTYINNLSPQQLDLIQTLIIYGLEQNYFNFTLLSILAFNKAKIQQIFEQVSTIYITKMDQIEFIFEHAQDVGRINYVYQIEEYEIKQKKIKFLQLLSKMQSYNDINNLHFQLCIIYDYSNRQQHNLGLENVMTQFFKKIIQVLPFKEFYKTSMEYIVEFSDIVNKQYVYQLIVDKYMDLKADINIKYLENTLLLAQNEQIQINNVQFDNVITRCSDNFVYKYYPQILKSNCNFNTKAYLVLLKLQKKDIYQLTSDEKAQQELLQLTVQFNQYSKINDILIFTKNNSEQLTSQQYDTILQNLQCLYTYFNDNNQLQLTKNLAFMISLVSALIKGPYTALQQVEYHDYIPNVLLNHQITTMLNNFDMKQTSKIVFLISYTTKQHVYFGQLIQCMIKLYNPIKTPQVLLQNHEILRYDKQGLLSQQKIDITFLLIYLQQEEVPTVLNTIQLDYMKNHIKYVFFKQPEFWQQCSVKNYCYYLLLCYILQDKQLNFQVIKYFIQKLQLKNTRSQQSLINFINQGQAQAFLQKTEIELQKDKIKQYFKQIESCYEDNQCISVVLNFDIVNEQQASILRAL